MKPVVLQASGLKKYYKSGDNTTRALDGVNLEVRYGKFVAVVGTSGCGKTTLLSLLGGLDSATKGKILFDGKDIMEKGLANHCRNHVSFIFQAYNLIDYMTPLENVKLTGKLSPEPILEKMGLTKEEMKRNVLQLSGGQQQRVAIARALASEAPVILADEPTGNLDEDTAMSIMQILEDSVYQMNKCAIIVTHSQEIVKRADVIFHLKRGTFQKIENN